MELDGAVEMTGPDHVDLVDRAGLGVTAGRVRDTLGGVAARAAPGPRQAPSGDDPFDGPTGRDGSTPMRRSSHATARGPY
jgi:hypothetical protein